MLWIWFLWAEDRIWNEPHAEFVQTVFKCETTLGGLGQWKTTNLDGRLTEMTKIRCRLSWLLAENHHVRVNKSESINYNLSTSPTIRLSVCCFFLAYTGQTVPTIFTITTLMRGSELRSARWTAINQTLNSSTLSAGAKCNNVILHNLRSKSLFHINNGFPAC